MRHRPHGIRTAPHDSRRPHPCGWGLLSKSQVQQARDPQRSDRANVLRLRALRALGDVELDLLVLVEGLVALRLDRRVVNEDVVAAVLLRDEAEALLRVEPLNSALSHVLDTP